LIKLNKQGKNFKCTSLPPKKFQLKKGIHDKKGNIGQANAIEDEHTQESTDQTITNEAFDVSQIDLYLNNLAATATAEKNVLDKLVKNNEKLIDQLAKLSAKFESLSSPNNNQTGEKPKY